MQRSHQLQHLPGSVLTEAAYLATLSTLSTTSSSFFLLPRHSSKFTWIFGSKIEKEAAEKNPNPEPELEIVEEVKNENLSPAQPDTEEYVGTDASAPTEVDDSASGRKLASVAARFVSAALRVFGI